MVTTNFLFSLENFLKLKYLRVFCSLPINNPCMNRVNSQWNKQWYHAFFATAEKDIFEILWIHWYIFTATQVKHRIKEVKYKGVLSSLLIINAGLNVWYYFERKILHEQTNLNFVQNFRLVHYDGHDVT